MTRNTPANDVFRRLYCHDLDEINGAASELFHHKSALRLTRACSYMHLYCRHMFAVLLCTISENWYLQVRQFIIGLLLPGGVEKVLHGYIIFAALKLYVAKY